MAAELCSGEEYITISRMVLSPLIGFLALHVPGDLTTLIIASRLELLLILTPEDVLGSLVAGDEMNLHFSFCFMYFLLMGRCL